MSANAFEARTISHLDLEKCFKRDDVKVIDVRDSDYFIGHIPGACHIPSSVFADELSNIAQELSAEKQMCVVNCLTGEARATKCALQLLRYLEQQCPGYDRNVCVLKGGFAAWEKHFGSKNIRGTYISRRLCLDGYSIEGAPRRVKLNKREEHPGKFPSWHAGHSVSSVASSVASLAVSSSSQSAYPNGLPLQETLVGQHAEQHSTEQHEVSQDSETLPVGKVNTREMWRKWLSVGDKVQVHSSSMRTWCSGIIIASEGTRVKVNFFDGNKVRIKILHLDSPDLQPEIDRVVTSASSRAGPDITRAGASCISRASSDTQSDSDAVSDSDGHLSCSSAWSAGSSQATTRPHRSGKGGFSTASSASGTQHLGGKCGSNTASASTLSGTESIEVRYMSQVDLAHRFDQGDLRIIDVRGLEYYTAHIAGAQHVPYEEFDKQLEEFAKEIANSGKTLVFYCVDSKHQGPWCARRIISYLEENYVNYNCRVFVLRGGFDGWLECCEGSDDVGQYIQTLGTSENRNDHYLFPIPSEEASSEKTSASSEDAMPATSSG